MLTHTSLFLGTYGILVFVLDMVTKIWIENFLTPLGDVRVFDTVSFSLHKNSGIAFSLPVPLGIQIFLSLLLLSGLIWIWKTQVQDMFRHFYYVSILAGALGNLRERILFGEVTDFIAVLDFPVFNLADASIFIGITGLIIHEILPKKTPPQTIMTFIPQFQKAKIASRTLVGKTTDQKNAVLRTLKGLLQKESVHIEQENNKDIIAFLQSGGSDSLTDRLLLNTQRILAIADDVQKVVHLPDEIGKVLTTKTHENGMSITQQQVPLGVVGMIYESRPNVTIDASVLGLKSGNAMILKGGKEARNTNRILVSLLHQALRENDFSEECIQFLDTDERLAVTEMLAAKEYIDIVIPRGGKGLIDFVSANACVPVIETGASVVHTYIDESADISEAADITINEKFRRVSVCNALDTILIDATIAPQFLRAFTASAQRYSRQHNAPPLQIHADTLSHRILSPLCPDTLHHATPEDYHTEWLEYHLNIITVSNIDEAFTHIHHHSLGHSESICSKNAENIQRFLREVDSACVYANSSTAFSDGMEFGLGAEIGISTQKLHVRGPFALKGLTSSKWVIEGSGHVR